MMTEAAIGHNEPKNKDWIAVYRSLRTHPIVGFLNPDGTRRNGVILCDTMAWIDLCMQANWKDLRENNKGHPVIVERGQLQGGRAWLAQRWGWSEKKVRIFLKKLTDDKMVILGPAKGPDQTPAKRNATNIITICNYDIYQTSIEILDGMEARERASAGASEGPARGHTVTKEQNKEREGASEPSRLKDGWVLPKEWGQWAEHNCKRDRAWVLNQAAKFKDYWLSVPDSKGFKKNWRATWQNWCRNTLEREAKYQRPAGGQRSGFQTQEERQREIDRKFVQGVVVPMTKPRPREEVA